MKRETSDPDGVRSQTEFLLRVGTQDQQTP